MKTGLIVEGGGMKCAYSAGVLDVFIEKGINFDVVSGVSAGAANAISYLAGQRERCRRFYSIHSMSKKYASVENLIRTGSFFGLNYIYRDLSNSDGADPINFKAVMANPAEFLVPATDAATGKTHIFTKDEISQDDYRVIMASCALPVMSEPVEIDGHLYFDGGVSNSIPVNEMKKAGCDKIVVLFSKPDGYIMKPQPHRLVYTFAMRKYPRIIWALNHRHEKYNRQINDVRRMEWQGKAFTYAPSADIKVSTYKVDQQTMEALYQNGRRDAESKMEELKKFLSTDKEDVSADEQ